MSIASAGLSAAFAQYLQTRPDSAGTAFTLVSVKTDGQPLVENGAEGYRMFVRTSVTLPNGYRAQCVKQICIRDNGFPPSRYKMTLIYDGSIDFTKTENGWRIASGTTDFGTPLSTVIDTPPPPDNTSLNGAWPMVTHVDSMCYNPWIDGHANLMFSGNTVSGDINGTPVTNGKIDEDTISIAAQQLTFDGTVERAKKRISGRWSNGAYSGSFVAAKGRADTPNLCTGGAISTPYAGAKHKGLGIAALGGNAVLRCIAPGGHLIDSVMADLVKVHNLDAARAVLTQHGVTSFNDQTTVSSQVSDELKSAIARKPIGEPVIIDHPGSTIICSMY